MFTAALKGVRQDTGERLFYVVSTTTNLEGVFAILQNLPSPAPKSHRQTVATVCVDAQRNPGRAGSFYSWLDNGVTYTANVRFEDNSPQ